MHCIKILLLEDNENDMELIKSELSSSLSYQLRFEWAITKADFHRKLNAFAPDIVISDYSLPQFSGLDALQLCLEKDTFLPFIIVTGSISEEAAADCIKSGAWDYVVKERLHRLPGAVENVLQLKKVRLHAQKVEAELNLVKTKSDLQLRMLWDAIDKAPSSILITNPEGIIQFVNSRFELTTGYSAEEVTGKHFRNFKSGLRDPETYQQLTDAVLSGKGWKGVIINQKKNGEYYWEEISLSPVTDSAGELLYLIAVEHDVTERKRMEEDLKTSEEKFRLISSSAQDGIILVDNYNKVIYWNPAAEKILGYSSAEALSKDIYDLVAPPHNRDQYRAVMGDYLHPDNPTKTGKISEMEVIKKDGALIIIEVSVAAIELPSGNGAVGIIRDISDRKRAEAELIAAKTKAEESDRLKSAFLSTMSHELRTPLNSIMGFSSLINPEMPPQEIEEMARLIFNGGANLLKIIESVFDVAILQSKGTSLSVSEFPLTDLFSSLSQYLAAEISKEGKARIETTFLPAAEVSRLLLKTDRRLLTQLLTNLLNNAVKYTEEGKIEYGYTREGDNITFFVSDTGIGIPTEKTGFIFDQFRQVEDAHTRKYGGVGLGLTICREIGQLLGGTFRVESQMGQGSTFYFTLPGAVLVIEKNESPPSKPPDLCLTGQKILVAEDIESNFELIRVMLRSTGVELLYARDGEEAVALVRAKDDIDLILMDMRMPGKDGFVATKEIKRMKPYLPVIAQTAYALQNERQKILEAGCNDCISKPFSRQTLINTITKHIPQ